MKQKNCNHNWEKIYYVLANKLQAEVKEYNKERFLLKDDLTNSIKKLYIETHVLFKTDFNISIDIEHNKIKLFRPGICIRTSICEDPQFSVYWRTSKGGYEFCGNFRSALEVLKQIKDYIIPNYPDRKLPEPTKFVPTVYHIKNLKNIGMTYYRRDMILMEVENISVVTVLPDGKISTEAIATPNAEIWFHILCRSGTNAHYEIITKKGDDFMPVKKGRIVPAERITNVGITNLNMEDRSFLLTCISDWTKKHGTG
jgi:hypothetical protein